MRIRANGEKILRLNTGNPAEFALQLDEVIHDLIMNASVIVRDILIPVIFSACTSCSIADY